MNKTTLDALTAGPAEMYGIAAVLLLLGVIVFAGWSIYQYLSG